MNSLDVSHQKSDYVRPDYLANPFVISCRSQARRQPKAKEAPASRRQSDPPDGEPQRASTAQTLGTLSLTLSCFIFVGLWTAEHLPSIASAENGFTNSFNMPSAEASALVPATPAGVLQPTHGYRAQLSPLAYGMSHQISSHHSSRPTSKAHNSALWLTKQHGALVAVRKREMLQ
jgi:hypothetical protein